MECSDRKQDVSASDPATKRSIRKIVQELKTRARWPDALSARRTEWSVDCGALSDTELEEVVIVLRRSGFDCSFERDYRTIVHFKLAW